MEIQGKDILFYISTNLVTPDWKTLICVETVNVNWASAVNKRPTRCGVKVGVADPEVVMTGQSVSDDAPGAAEVSHLQMQGFIKDTTPVLVKAAHVTTPAKYFVSGTGYLTSLDESAQEGEALDFSWQFDITGIIDTTP
jgi:hypothetical protein